MKPSTRKTRMDDGAPLRWRRLILLLTTVLLGGGSPCVVVNSTKTASGAASIRAAHNPPYTQFCNPAVVNYILRDENGKVLTETEIKTVYEQLPKAIGDARLYSGQVSFTEDARTFYWPESVDWQKGRKLPSLEFVNSETCTMHLTEVTLIYHDKKMRLVFDINIAKSQSDRRLVVDSLPFQEGTFGLDLSGGPVARDQIIPAERWKRVKT
jgi:hypothetical protein